MKYIVLISHKHFYEDREWEFFDNLEDAKNFVEEEFDESYNYEIREIGDTIAED